jgi:hypothetical protein
MTSTIIADHIAPDEPWKLALCAALILTVIVWTAWTRRRENAYVRAIARSEGSKVVALIEPLADAVFDTAEMVAAHGRVIELAQADPEQEAIDAAIAESEAEEHQAHVMLGRRMVV